MAPYVNLLQGQLRVKPLLHKGCEPWVRLKHADNNRKCSEKGCLKRKIMFNP